MCKVQVDVRKKLCRVQHCARPRHPYGTLISSCVRTTPQAVLFLSNYQAPAREIRIHRCKKLLSCSKVYQSMRISCCATLSAIVRTVWSFMIIKRTRAVDSVVCTTYIFVSFCLLLWVTLQGHPGENMPGLQYPPPLHLRARLTSGS